ncbi:MAG TPA: apolipoprotein N-acyltransferase [Phycicoccus sp.]
MPTPLRTLARPLAALLAGLALWLSFPEHDLWWLAPVGVALLAAATLTAGFWRGAALGLLAGVAYFGPTLSWAGVYVGLLPQAALAVLEALYVAGMSALVGFTGRRLVAAGHRAAALAVVPLAWVAQEWARSTTPYGGFPWARLAFGQADSPLAHVARWLGAPGVTLAVAVAGTGLLALAWGVAEGRGRLVVGGLLAAVLPWAAGWAPLPTDGRTVAVGFVQGDVPQAGLEFNAQRRAVLDNHVRGTLELARTAPADLTLVVWPENASDIDPFRNPDADAEIRASQQALGVPLVVGAVLAEPPGASSNVSLFYTGPGEPQRYTKLHPVPFAEYIPHRAFFRIFTPAADLAGNFVAGDTIGVFHVPAPGGQYAALPTICFEVAYDGLVRDSVAAAADGEDGLLMVQTNNATFGYTAESEQQFAISRIRAIEHGRSVVHASTVGVSGFIAPDGSVTGKTGLFTAEQRVGRPVLRHETTPSDALGEWPQVVLTAALAALVIAAAVGGRRVRVSRRPDRPRTDPVD